MPSATADGMGPVSKSAEEAASLTPTGSSAAFPLPGTGTGSNSGSNANGIPYLLFLATLAIGGGAFFAFAVRSRKAVYEPSWGGAAAASMAIHPAAVGASGFSAWLADQAPLLTDGEKVVLSKVGNGIISALHLSGRISDLTRISERGPQEFLQLATGPR